MTKFAPDQNSLTFPDSRLEILKFPDFPEGNIFPWLSLMVGTLKVGGPETFGEDSVSYIVYIFYYSIQ